MGDGRFIAGEHRSHNKICVKCASEYVAPTGSMRWCPDCRGLFACKMCAAKIDPYHKFCSPRCSAKWAYTHSAKVKAAIAIGLKAAHATASARMKATAGIAKPHFRGANNPNWKGGTYGTERHRLMGRVEYINWRKAVYERDNYTCQMCSKRGGKLNADHIIPYHIDKSLALDVDNGRTLCFDCHKTTPTWGHKVHSYMESMAEKGRK